jgi:hypothetical protein
MTAIHLNIFIGSPLYVVGYGFGAISNRREYLRLLEWQPMTETLYGQSPQVRQKQEIRSSH